MFVTPTVQKEEGLMEEGLMTVQDSWMNGQPRGAIIGSTQNDSEVFGATQTDACVLFTGKTEAAKSLAQGIHKLSGWRHGPFVSVDCSWSEATLESRLFGALLDDDTSPSGLQPGYSQQRTLFLQEIGRLSPTSQARLADHLTELRTQGGRRVRWRVMASSPETLLDRVNAGTFNDRLYYRLNVIHLILPDHGDAESLKFEV
jgi:DNA-binding NtrC family response regulator